MAGANEIFENLGKTFTRTADMVVKKTDEFLAVQKVKNRKSALEKQMNSTYLRIGKQIFEEYAAGGAMAEDIAGLCEKIKKLQGEIENCNSEIEDIKGSVVNEPRRHSVHRDANVEDAEFESADEEDDFDFFDKEEVEDDEEEAEEPVKAAPEEADAEEAEPTAETEEEIPEEE